MGKHVSILGGLYIILDVLFLVVGAFLLGLILFAGEVIQSPTGETISQAAAIGLGVFLLVLSIPGLIVGIGLLKRQNWARIIAMVLGVINLFNVPVGTILGVYTLWVLLNPHVTEEFSDNGRSGYAKERHAI